MRWQLIPENELSTKKVVFMEKLILLIGFMIPMVGYSQAPTRCLSSAHKAGQYMVDIKDVNVPYLSNTDMRITVTEGGRSRVTNLQALHAASKISPWVFFHDSFQLVIDHRSKQANDIYQGELAIKDRHPIKVSCKILGGGFR